MKKFFFVTLFAIFCICAGAQSKKKGSPAMDSLKQSFKAVGNLFKKSTKITIRVKDAQAGDKNLLGLVRDLQGTPGVTNIKSGFEQSDAVLHVSFKGKGQELWESVPPGSSQLFNPTGISDTAIHLAYKNAFQNASPVAVTSVQSAEKSSNTTPGSANESKPQPGSLSKGAMLMFKNVKSKLNVAEKNAFFSMTEFWLSKDGKQFTLGDKESAEFPFDVSVFPTDLNKDGKEELFLIFGNTFTSGNTGSNAVAYIRDKTGKYIANLGFPAATPEALTTSNLGYPDLLITGPGFEFPVWRWNGKEYAFYRKQKVDEVSYAKLKSVSIDTISKKYMAALK